MITGLVISELARKHAGQNEMPVKIVIIFRADLNCVLQRGMSISQMRCTRDLRPESIVAMQNRQRRLQQRQASQ